VAARRAALRLLDAVLRRGVPLEAALDGAARELDRGDDRALAHAIAATCLRRLPDLDALIDSATRNRLADDAKARFALRIALAQALILGTPAHAAISTVLPLVDGGPRKLVHGVFGTLMRGNASLPETPSLPPEVAARWAADWGDGMVEGAMVAIAAPPPLDLTLADASATDHWVAELGGTSLMPGHVRLAEAGHVRELPGFDEGKWWVQDLAASLPARLLGAGDGRGVLDLCAAPGGKTMQLAAAGWRVTSVEQSQSRLARLRENLDRTGLDADLVGADVMRWTPPAPADAILLDAPCSATGIFRRHPDVLHRVRPKDIAAMAEIQSALLARAIDWLAPDGTIVFATCSLERQEGEAHVDRLLAGRNDVMLDPILPAELPDEIVPHQQGWVRTSPALLADRGGIDGFFIARLRRIA